MYYLQGQTMETIARHLQISRSSVSRLLAHAREVGLVRISVSASPGLKGTLAGQIADLFGVQVSCTTLLSSLPNTSSTCSSPE